MSIEGARTYRSYGFRQRVIETHEPLVINHDMDRLMEEYHNPVVVGEPVKSAVFVPMIAGDHVSGVISLQNIDRENAFSDSDVRLLQTLANSMSVALENAVSSTRPSACSKRPNNAMPNWRSLTAYKKGWPENWISRKSLTWSESKSKRSSKQIPSAWACTMPNGTGYLTSTTLTADN